MPITRVKDSRGRVGYQWGASGKVYKTRAAAERQASAIRAGGYGTQKTTAKTKTKAKPKR